jgi:tetratricopeptide (TPR) repeat protein
MSKLLLKIFLLIALSSIHGLAQSAASKDSIASRLQNISKLLHESSGARQVINSSNSAAKQKHRQALELYRQASEKFDQGANDDAVELLNQSTRSMFEAIKMATPVSLTEDKNIKNYAQRKLSVTALRDAFNRISDESNESDSKQKVNNQLDQLITRADELLGKGDNTEARSEIDKAYHLLKVSIESIEDGKTLVRSLHFETKEEEYHYEIDRNDTHDMLIQLLVEGKEKSDYSKTQITKFVAEAKVLRQQADAYAGDGAYEVAIGLLEQSTKQLVRAIRSAGIYIPG